ncbi:MAG: PAS domain S-box protein [Thermonemataceae bacterium]|nr:PAS domain S-box protein [Thermonemataceae bacterium]
MFRFFPKLRIAVKISALLLLVVLASVLAVSFFAYEQSKSTVEERYLESLNGVADLKVQKLKTFIGEINTAIQIGQDLKPIRDFLKKKQEGKTEKKKPDTELTLPEDSLGIDTTNNPEQIENPFGQEELGAFNEELENAITTIQFTYKLNNVYILDKNGNVIYIARETPEQVRGQSFKTPAIDPAVVIRGRDTTYFSKVTLQQLGKEKKVVFLVSAPIRENATADRTLIGQIIYELDMAYVEKLIADRVGLGETGQVWLLQEQDKRIVYLNSFQDGIKKVSPLDNAGSKEDESTAQIILSAIKKEQKQGSAIEERDYLAVSRFVPAVEWGVVVKNDKAEIYAPANALLNKFLLAGLIVLIISVIIGVLFSQFLTKPLASLQKTIDLLGKGEVPPVLVSDSQDEIGEMTNRLNALVENLNRTAFFAQSIGSQVFDTDYTPASEKDMLGNALLNAREKLMESYRNSSKQGWVSERLNKINDILRSTDNLDVLAEQIISYVVQEVGAIQGAFYVMRRDEEQVVDTLKMIASYAYNKKKYLNAEFKIFRNKYAEGLVGQAAIEKSIIQRTEIPDDYVSITSGLLGEKKPQYLHISPLITNDTKEVYGVIELAAISPFDEQANEFIQQISDSIARTIFNILVSENRRVLLEQQQKLTTDLQENQRILSESAKELEMKNQEVAKTNIELSEKVKEVENEQAKTESLLENASEVITIYDINGKISYVSPSIKRILGYEASEMIGNSDLDNIEQGKERFKKMFEDLLQFPDESHAAIQFLYRTQDGDNIWLEATGTNLINNPAINGIVINSRDITERLKAEREQRMRSQMQALSENSPDLILRMNDTGKVFYVNPTIKSLTGHDKELIENKSISTDYVPQNVLNSWFKLIEAVKRRGSKQDATVDFETVEQKTKKMNVNVIPEKNDETGDIETFLLVSHDITEMEEARLKIEESEKKVRDSINYAKRIQASILPNTQLLQSIFPDSFVMFKPKDIVSGDFPWMFQTERALYAAVVDCTGHGVPGALISLIGYFLLNNIFSVHDNLAPSEVLDLLDEAVVRTLRQTEEDSVSKDGMDVSLCKISLETAVMEYSGAHRPLYYVDVSKNDIEDALEEVKGDKMPVGGGQYKNRGAFANYKREYKKGDFILMFSDGLPDQFGGPDNRKFSPRRIRDIIKSNIKSPMMKIDQAIEEELNIWMKFDGRKYEVKQTDDILVIGIRF